MNWYRFKNRILSQVLSLFPSLAKRFVEAYAPRESEGIPWVPMTKPLADCTIAVVTTAGVHHRDQTPFDMIDKNGDPSYREIDSTLPPGTLMITHDYYDHADADRDMNIVLPLERLREFEQEGFIGCLARYHYGFMGHITGPHIPTLMTGTAPEMVRLLKKEAVDAVLLTPG